MKRDIFTNNGVTHAGVAEAEAVYTAGEVEVEMFRRHSHSYGYTFFVLQN